MSSRGGVVRSGSTNRRPLRAANETSVVEKAEKKTAPPASSTKAIHKDMRGLTAIKKSEAALRTERDTLQEEKETLVATNEDLSARLQDAEDKLEKIEEMHAFATSELRGQVEAQVRAAAEAQEVMEGKHHAALAALKAEHAKEKATLERKLRDMQTAIEKAGLSAITLSPLPAGAEKEQMVAEMDDETKFMTETIEAALARAEELTARTLDSLSAVPLPSAE